MPVLTAHEGEVIDVTRKLAPMYPAGIPVYLIKSRAWDYGVGYDAVDRALKGLIAKELVVKVKRGLYLPREAESR